MVTETFTTGVNKLIAGSLPGLVTQKGTLKSGENLPAYTFVESDNTGDWIEHTGINATTKIPNFKVVGMLTNAYDASGGDLPAVVYVSGCFHASELTWHTDLTSNLLKSKFLENTMIKAVFLATGEV